MGQKTIKKSDTDSEHKRLFNTVFKLIRFSKKIIVVSIICVITYTIVDIIISFPNISDVLTSEFFGFFKVEGGTLGAIKIFETVVSAINNKYNSQNADYADDVNIGDSTLTDMELDDNHHAE